MRRFLAVLPVAALLSLVGCNHWPPRPDNGVAPPPMLSLKTEPKAADLVAYLNGNAAKVPGLFCQNVYIDARQGTQQPIGMDATMACDKSRDFRMKAKVAGSAVADFGSNQDEFWYWITKADPPYVFHGKYADMKDARTELPIPFQPDLVIAALGVGEYDPNGQYEVRTNKDVVELIEPAVSIQGKKVWKITVFNRGPVTATRPQVLAYVLKDEKGKDIAVATITATQVNRETGAVLPRSIQLTLVPERTPNDKVEMKMVFDNLQVKNFDKDQRASMFSLRDALDNRQGFNLVSGAADAGPGAPGMGMSIQRTNGSAPR